MENDELLERAADVRRGVARLARRLRLERRQEGEPLLQLTVLALLRSRGPMTPGDLADAERVQPQSLTRTLAALEDGGLVTRRSDPHDGRRSLLAITRGGLRALRDDVRQRDAWLAAAMAEQLSPVEHELLRLSAELMERLAESDVTALHAPLDRDRTGTRAPSATRALAGRAATGARAPDPSPAKVFRRRAGGVAHRDATAG